MLQREDSSKSCQSWLLQSNSLLNLGARSMVFRAQTDLVLIDDIEELVEMIEASVKDTSTFVDTFDMNEQSS